MTSTRIGVISDTHGLLRREVKDILQTCDLIIHAGDIDRSSLLEELKEIAPTTVVRGNMDFGPWANTLKITERVQVGKWSILVVHNIQELPELGETDLVIFGHSHKFFKETKDGVLFLNPGSVGPRRFTLPISMAILTLGEEINIEQVLLRDKV